MKIDDFYYLIYFFFSEGINAENVLIQSKNITLDKEKEVSIFQSEVFVRTDKNHTIESEYAEYDKKKKLIKFKESVRLKDSKNNIILTNNAQYDENFNIFNNWLY